MTTKRKDVGDLPEANTSSDNKIPEHPLLARLVAESNAKGNLISLRGYVGPSATEGSVALYPSLDNLAVRVEIARSNVVEFAPADTSAQPSGQTILWIRRDAQVTIHRVRTMSVEDFVNITRRRRVAFTEIRKGRLQMRVPRFATLGKLHSVLEPCQSVCAPSCFSICFGCSEPCDSRCGPH